MKNEALSRMPKEVSALIHHVELNRAGWWEKALNRLVLAAIWLNNKNSSIEEIHNLMQQAFGYTINSEKLKSILISLEKEDCLVLLPDGRYRITDQARDRFENEIEEAETVQRRARELFFSLAADICPTLDANEVWTAFEEDLLFPLIRDSGANTYLFLTGKQTSPNILYLENFFNKFGKEYQKDLKNLVTSYLDPKNNIVRGFINRLLHVQFCLESFGLSEEVLEKLKNAISKPIKFNLFVDTNFLFSLMGLHENPSNASASELKELLTSFNENPQVEFYIIPRTIKEAKTAIEAAKRQVENIPMSSNFTEAALRVGVSGLSERFFNERKKRNNQLSPDIWFEPYLKNFVTLAKTAGVKLYEENFDHYATRQDVIDDILSILEYEKKLPLERRKSYEKIEHDVILWHVVKDKRPVYVESPIDAQEWILTVDFRFLGFDLHKLKVSASNIPVCLHPTTLIQLLQFWIPRSVELEEAMLAGLMLPFLFQEFDAKAERLSLHIIKQLGRFEGSEAIPQETLIKVVMNEGLRARIEKGLPEEQEMQLIRDALVEELRLQTEVEKEKVEKLKTTVKDKNDELIKLRKESEAKDAEIKKLQNKLDNEEAKSRATSKELSELKSRIEKIEKEKAFMKYLKLFFLVVSLSVIGGWQIGHTLAGLGYVFGPFWVYIATGLFIFIILHSLLEWILKRDQWMTNLWPFRQVKRFRKWLWTLAITLLLSVAANLIVANIQNAKSTQSSNKQTLHPELRNNNY